MLRLLLAFPLVLTACAQDETISAFVDTAAIYRLSEIDGRPFPASATISFPEKGLVRGQAPCNSYSAEQTAPYPWFELGPIKATRRFCPDLSEEARFFDALSGMSLAEVTGNVLVLRDDQDRELVFVKTAPGGQ